MDSRRTLLVDAFTDEPLAGNAAGGVPDAEGLTADQMQRVARELNASETAFLTDSEEADRQVRYFTPSTEVDLCGHATVACHAHLFEDGVIDAGSHTLATNVGVLDIDVDDDGTVWMTQAPPELHEVEVSHEDVAAAVGVDLDALTDVADDLPLAWSSTGLAFLVVPVARLDDLGNATPDMAAVESLCETVDATGVYAFTFETLDPGATLHGRMFAPLAGVPEDPVTGTASGAVGAYLRAYDAFEGAMGAGDDGEGGEGGDAPPADEAGTRVAEGLPEEMVFEQGHFVDRPGRALVRARGEVRVGGRALTALDGSLAVPDAEDDDVIEA
ncbi:PhzF family phenazine biosynthesis protein [Halomarina ordinaria]|uniref:PhzF family phenazine biosynthesis protein n=1 Tax=Halomarina ordinaria TaxID=3033939 RepID=A0ABD5U7J5_9EURY|nr:PhzF family phenazine biosynthesis protein [Halomarina sp. PSRA2]